MSSWIPLCGAGEGVREVCLVRCHEGVGASLCGIWRCVRDCVGGGRFCVCDPVSVVEMGEWGGGG